MNSEMAIEKEQRRAMWEATKEDLKPDRRRRKRQGLSISINKLSRVFKWINQF